MHTAPSRWKLKFCTVGAVSQDTLREIMCFRGYFCLWCQPLQWKLASAKAALGRKKEKKNVVQHFNSLSWFLQSNISYFAEWLLLRVPSYSLVGTRHSCRPFFFQTNSLLYDQKHLLRIGRWNWTLVVCTSVSVFFGTFVVTDRLFRRSDCGGYAVEVTLATCSFQITFFEDVLVLCICFKLTNIEWHCDQYFLK